MELAKTTSLKFEVTATGHQIIQAEINGHTVRLILDVSAQLNPHTNINATYA